MPQEYKLILKHADEPGYTPDIECYLRHGGYDAVKKALAQRDDMGLVQYARLGGGAAATAVETPDHYLPFLYALGASDSLQEVPQTMFEGFHSGSLSMGMFFSLKRNSVGAP